MREADVTAAFARILPPSIYALKIALKRGCKQGVPDSWYSGPARDLWVEWKHLKTKPRHIDAAKLLTPHQFKWLAGRQKEGRNVAVFVSSLAGICVFDDMENLSIGGERLQHHQLTRRELATLLTAYLEGARDELLDIMQPPEK